MNSVTDDVTDDVNVGVLPFSGCLLSVHSVTSDVTADVVSLVPFPVKLVSVYNSMQVARIIYAAEKARVVV